MIANLIFPGQMFLLEPQDLSEGGLMRVSVRKLGTQVSGAKVLTNVLSLASVAAGGAGLFYLDVDGGPSKRVDWALRLSPRDGGTDLAVELETNAKASRLPAKMHTAWVERVTGLGPALRAYLLRVALFGLWAQGAPLFMLTREAAAARLQALGVEGQSVLGALGFAD